MPKKKKVSKDQKHDGEITERPAQLTLGDFLSFKLQTSSEKSTSTQQAVKSESVGKNCGISEAVSVQGIDNREEKKLEPEDKSYFVCRTKKGGVPIKVENRASGKKVTLIEHVIGDSKSLLQDLKIKFGTGGLIKDNAIELQGDFKVKLSKYFNDNKHLLRPYGCVK